MSEFNANGFVLARSKQILAMYGIDTNQIQKSQSDAVDLQKSQESQALAEQQTQQQETVNKEAEIQKSEQQAALATQTQNDENDFQKSLEDLMAPISFD